MSVLAAVNELVSSYKSFDNTSADNTILNFSYMFITNKILSLVA